MGTLIWDFLRPTVHNAFVLHEDRARPLTMLHGRNMGDHGWKLKWEVQVWYREKLSSHGTSCPRRPCWHSPQGLQPWAAWPGFSAEPAAPGLGWGHPECRASHSCQGSQDFKCLRIALWNVTKLPLSWNDYTLDLVGSILGQAACFWWSFAVCTLHFA